MANNPFIAILIIGFVFLTLQIYVAISIIKNKNGERFIFNQKQDYQMQLYIEKWFG